MVYVKHIISTSKYLPRYKYRSSKIRLVEHSNEPIEDSVWNRIAPHGTWSTLGPFHPVNMSSILGITRTDRGISGYRNNSSTAHVKCMYLR